MKKSVFLYVILFSQVLFAQNVVLNKVSKTNSNSDRFLYKINPEVVTSEYLGEIEVQGFSDDDVKVFGMIYKKAKEVGANAFSYLPFEAVEGGMQKFDPAHYRLSLYYVAPDQFSKEDNIIYLIASPFKKQTIAINKANRTFQPRTFTKMMLTPGEVYTVSTRKLLGSAIKLSAQENQPVQFFQFSAFSMNSNTDGNAGINLKSGDITRLEQSYAQFLTTVYQYQE
ncbi:hypothetical protein [Kaistella faecalis]|uniref:hypothetical protein n=1 Tax=Kaistella faecalis TaxID=2852098 RepID=UPI001C4591EE|nr:hypothetical protein [Chryseobacterium faecale]UFK96924.1 hypothetical protein LL667_08030 [Chryseobacterium faecale]